MVYSKQVNPFTKTMPWGLDKEHGICEAVMELCCALHNFRVRLTP
jgi:hypothetical protein